MDGNDIHQKERQTILTNLLSAVKECQVRFGGRSELATDSDSRVSCLCAAWDSTLQHGMKKNSKAFSAFKQMTERAGLGKVTDLFSDIKKIDSDPVYWHYVKDHLTKHEVQRFTKLKLVNTDGGRGRAWLRASLNEHSLERYMHMIIERDDLLAQAYEDWAFLRDLERNSMLPNMAAGLGSILFAITVDRPELNDTIASKKTIHVQGQLDSVEISSEEPKPVISGDVSPGSARKKDKKKKKKKVANVISFDGDEPDEMINIKSGSTSSSQNLDIAQHSNEPVRVVSEGTAENYEEVFREPSALREESDQPGHYSAASYSSQVSSPSIHSETSGSVEKVSKSSTNSFSDLDHDTNSSSFMVPVGVDGVVVATEMMPLNNSATSNYDCDVEEHSTNSSGQGVMESATMALALAQQSLSNSNYGVTSDIGKHDTDDETSRLSMTQDELKDAVVAMMLRKDSVQEQNSKLQGMLEHEMEASSTLRAEIEDLKLQYANQHERAQSKIVDLQKENELLKHQLKKYVSAVQMLQTEGAKRKDSLGINLDEPQPSIPPAKPNIDYSHEASEYEQKLIQVAEMHGELIEFNEMLQKSLATKEAALRRLKEELIMLRGPLPHNCHMSNDFTQDADTNFLRPLINIWIPSAFLRGSSSKTHHVYQVYVRIHDEEWNIYRRYSQFLDLHTRLKKVHPLVGKFEFPPKKAIGKKEARLVESRRQIFQTYLRSIINVLMEKDNQLAQNANKERLISYLPFFNDKGEEAGSRKGSNTKTAAAHAMPISAREGATGESRGYQGL